MAGFINFRVLVIQSAFESTHTRTYQDLCDPTASDGFRFADNAEGIVG